MRLGFGLIVGLLVVLLGVSIVLRAVFQIEVPLFRTALGLALVFFGAKLVFDAWSPSRVHAPESAALMEGRTFAPTGATGLGDLKYSVTLGTGTVDLTGLPAEGPPRRVEVDTVFGQTVIRVDPAVPYEVDASAAFGEARLPSRDATFFGSAHYRSGGPPHLLLKMNVVFGQAEIREVSVEREQPLPVTPRDELGAPAG